MKIILIILIIFSFTSCSKNKNKILILGDKDIPFVIEGNLDYSFTSSKSKIKDIYTLVTKNSLSLNDNEKIKTKIKKSKEIYINCGKYNILPYIRIENKKAIFLQGIDEAISLFELYYFLLVEEIKEINKNVIIYGIKIVSPYENIINYNEVNSYFSKLNEAIVENKAVIKKEA